MVTRILTNTILSPIDRRPEARWLAGGHRAREQGGKAWCTSVASVQAHGQGEIVTVRIITRCLRQNRPMPALPPGGGVGFDDPGESKTDDA
jgi:hypothetical protein